MERATPTSFARSERAASFSHAIFNCILQLCFCSDGAFTICFGKYRACPGGTSHDNYSFS